MKKTLIALSSIVILTGMAGTALADGSHHSCSGSNGGTTTTCPDGSTPFDLTLTHTWDQAVFIGASGSSASYTFDLTDPTLVNPAFNPANDTILSVKIFMDITDDQSGDGYEKAHIELGSALWDTQTGDLDTGSDWNASFSSGTVLTSLSTTGLLGITISQLCGDFYLNSIGLTASGCSSPADAPNAPVPEPATMLLFGSGLAGLASLKRRTSVKPARR